MLIVAKFGGSSLADAEGFRAVGEILRADPKRRCVVVSAPGRRSPEDRKLTDLLYDCYAERGGGAWRSLLRMILERFDAIAADLDVKPDWLPERERLSIALADGTAERDYVASRGEYFCAKLMAAYLRRTFLDSADWLRMNADGTADLARSYAALQALAKDGFVTPGFYGALADGTIRTFPRGGSDVTGALAAAALRAECYENWTDVPGLFEADPSVFPEARPVRFMTYRELAALGAVGVQVLHSGAIRPMREAGIPLLIRSTRQPDDPGTRIAPEKPADLRRGRLLCLGARRELALLQADAPSHLNALLRKSGVVPVFCAETRSEQTALIPAEPLPEQMELFSPAPGGIRVESGLSLIAVILAEASDCGKTAAELPALLEQNGVPVHAILFSGADSALLLAIPDDHFHFAVRVLLQAARLNEDADPFGA